MKRRIEVSYVTVLIVSILLGFALFVAPLHRVEALPAGDTFTVTNTNASGAGSLSQAIADANGNTNPAEQDVISFDISGAGDKIITPSATLEITEPVLLDGYTQGDAVANTQLAPEYFDGTIRIEINQANATDGITVTADDVTVRGLSIYGSLGSEIIVQQASNFVLEGSYLSLDASGLLTRYNSSNPGTQPLIHLQGVTNARIGGSAGSERNVIGQNELSMIMIESYSGTDSESIVIQGNNMGVGSDSLAGEDPTGAWRALTAIVVKDGSNNITIGGEEAGAGNTIANVGGGAILAYDMTNLNIMGNSIQNIINGINDYPGFSNECGAVGLAGVNGAIIGSDTEFGGNNISGNGIYGLCIQDSPLSSEPSTDISVIGNTFGYDLNEEVEFPNVNGNIRVSGESNYVHIASNKIHNADNSMYDPNPQSGGIDLVGDVNDVSIISNSIYNNSGLGIDIYDSNSVQNNDPLDTDTGPNDILNYPENISDEVSGGSTVIRYELDVPAGEYRIDFFSNTVLDDSGFGEGETFLGYQEITHAGAGEQDFEWVINSTGLQNITTTATEIDESSPNGYGSTSEFSGPAGDPLPEIDLGSNIELLNPEDVEIGADLQYKFTITNYGPDSIDLVGYDGTMFGQNSLLLGILPTDLTYVGVSSITPDIACTGFGSGSASFFGPILADHSDHELINCGYMGGGYILDVNESIELIITAEVTGSSDLDFIIHSINLSQEYDPDYDYIADVGGSGNDMLTYFLANYPPNNYALSAYPIEDLNYTKVLAGFTEDMEVGDPLSYEITIQNDGVTPVDLIQFDAGGVNPFLTALIIDVLPPELSYVSVSDENLLCQWSGMGSGSVAGPILASHPDYSILVCGYNAPLVLQPGDTHVFTIETQIAQEIDASFTNHLIGSATNSLYDPDYLTHWRAITASFSGIPGYDFLNNLQRASNGSSQSYSSAAYIFEAEEPGTNPGNGGNTPGGGGSDGGLAETGRDMILLTAASLIFGALVVLASTYMQRSTEKRTE